jgi:pantetheine-phosphate adenylyltransferase
VPKAVVPGSFDPVTLGHLDVITRTAALFDEVVVAVLVNEAKRSMFSVAERIDMIEHEAETAANLTVMSFDGLLVDFCRRQSAVVIVKGLRAPADLDVEVQMAHMNSHLSGVETLLLPTSPQLSFVSSSLIKEVARFGGDVSGLVTPYVRDRLRQRLLGTPELDLGDVAPSG